MNLFKKKEIVKAESKEVVTDALVKQYIQTMMPTSGLTEAETIAFCTVAKQWGLNPFKREIYCIPYEKNVKLPNGQWAKERALSLITGYEVYLKKAVSTGKLDSWKVWTEGEAPKLKAKVEIYIRGSSHPFTWEVDYEEYAQTDYKGNVNKMWSSKPKTMIKKVAVGQAFRMAFPEEMGGMPYTSDELPDNMTQEKNVTPEPKTVEPQKEMPETLGGDENIEDAEIVKEIKLNDIAQLIMHSGMAPEEKAKWIGRATSSKDDQSELYAIYKELGGQ